MNKKITHAANGPEGVVSEDLRQLQQVRTLIEEFFNDVEFETIEAHMDECLIHLLVNTEHGPVDRASDVIVHKWIVGFLDDLRRLVQKPKAIGDRSSDLIN